jgi:hypothetical protein
MCARHEDDALVVEEFELSLWFAAGYDIWRGTSSVMKTQFQAAYFRLLSPVEVVLASARDVHLLLLLK